MEDWDAMVERITERRRAERRAKNRLESEKEHAEFGYAVANGKFEGPWLAPLPGGKDNRPAEKLLTGKVRGRKRQIWPSIGS